MKPGDLPRPEQHATAPAGSHLRPVLRAGAVDLEDFAFGFSYTEGIIRSSRDIYGVDIVEEPRGFIVQIDMASACLNQLKLRRRSLAGRSGCGLCGIESLDEVRRVLPALPTRPGKLSAQAISRAVEQLRALQPLHLATGATHAAGWADCSGNIQHVREDVGRHNALDKLIGHLIRHSLDPAQGIAVISSRASFEMVQKAAAAGIPAVVAVSAPTTYAAQMADELNILLAGFARGSLFTVYSHPEYLSTPGNSS
jgi:FdhD protein